MTRQGHLARDFAHLPTHNVPYLADAHPAQWRTERLAGGQARLGTCK